MKASLHKLAAPCILSICFLFANNTNALETIDVLILYLPEATEVRNGRDIPARAASYIEYTNTAFGQSGVDMQLRLVGLEPIEIGSTAISGDSLQRLASNDRANDLRRQYGADVVTLLAKAQERNGGYICGIGYIPYGDASRDRFYRGARNSGFNITGINCGLSTFAHEVGHNLGLGHSARQGSTGGVYTWGRGHGVYGNFATIMAYPHSYGTYQQVQYFSNPDVFECQGLACGSNRNADDGADAAESLNRLGSQLADFSPTIVTDNSDDNGNDDSPNLGDCAKSKDESNLIENSEFNDLNGWRSTFNYSTLERDTHGTDCLEYRLKISSRSKYYSSAYYSLQDKLEPGTEYLVSLKLGIAGASRENVRVAFRRYENGSESYDYSERLSTTNQEMTTFTYNYQFDSGDVDGVLIYGPPAGIDILVDSVSITPVIIEEPPVVEDIYVIDQQFELDAKGWRSFYGTDLRYSSNAAQGEHSLESRRRQSIYSGPLIDVTGILAADQNYELSVEAYLKGNSQGENFNIWAYVEDDNGGRWEKLADQYLVTDEWQTISSEFTINANGTLRTVALIFVGPPAEIDINIDNLKVKEL